MAAPRVETSQLYLPRAPTRRKENAGMMSKATKAAEQFWPWKENDTDTDCEAMYAGQSPQAITSTGMRSECDGRCVVLSQVSNPLHCTMDDMLSSETTRTDDDRNETLPAQPKPPDPNSFHPAPGTRIKTRCCAAGRGSDGGCSSRSTDANAGAPLHPAGASSAPSQSGSSARRGPAGACYERRSRHCHSKWRAHEPQTGALSPTLAGPSPSFAGGFCSVSARLRRWEINGGSVEPRSTWTHGHAGHEVRVAAQRRAATRRGISGPLWLEGIRNRRLQLEGR